MSAKTFAGERVAIIGVSIAGLLAARILHESVLRHSRRGSSGLR